MNNDSKAAINVSVKKLGSTLRMLRKQSGYTIDELAGLVDISAKTLARIEKAESGVSVNKLFALTDVLGVAPDELIRRATATAAVGESEWPEEATKELEFAREFIKAKYNLK